MEGTLRGPHAPGLRLIETLRWSPGTGYTRLPAHLARMADSARRLGFPFPAREISAALAEVAGPEAVRVRLTLAGDGRIEVGSAPLGPARPAWTVMLARERTRSDDPWLGVKTTARRLYDHVRAALPPGVDEALFLNEKNELTEGTITNIFVDRGNGLLTPPLACGVLPGILRAEMLARGIAREASLDTGDLRRGRVLVGNSLRGLIPANVTFPE